MPRQFTMLKNAPYIIIPVFKSKELNGKYVSNLNPFSTIWCVIENIFLAATAEGLGCSMRIPLNEEHDIVKARNGRGPHLEGRQQPQASSPFQTPTAGSLQIMTQIITMV